MEENKMINISDCMSIKAAWTNKNQWESGFHRSAISATRMEIAWEPYLLSIDFVLNRNLEPQFETYYMGNGQLEGVAVIEPEK